MKRRGRLLILLALLIGVAGFMYYRGPGQRFRVKLTVFDELADPGEEVTLKAKLEHDGPVGINPDMRGYGLKFEAALWGSQDAKNVKTAGEGIAWIKVKFPEAVPGPYPFKVTFTGSDHHQKAEATGRVFLWPKTAPILLTDIDHTISDLSQLKVPLTDVKDNPTLPGAAEALTELAKTYRIVYLTARDDALFNYTRRWLKAKDFPEGPVFCRDYYPGQSQEGFKRRFITDLKKRFPNLRIGVGDRESDAAAYLANGLKAIIIDPDQQRDLPKEAVRVGSWKEIQESLVPKK